MQRWIMHIDMDAFYASIEQLDHPEWRGRPLVVGGGDRGVVSAASYEVRKYGVHSAMPIFQARKLCPQAIFTPGRMGRYAEVSRQVMTVLGRFSPLVEKASIDEAYLDASGLERLFGSIEDIGRRIKAEVRQETGLTCSIGAAPVKFLAKIASDLNKPDGLSILYPAELQEFLRQLPLEKIPGLGKQTLKRIASFGMRTAGDAQAYTEDFWVQRFGKAGLAIYERCRGIDGREVEPCAPPKSESAENTFAKDTMDLEELKTWLLRQAERVGSSLRKLDLCGRTITLKVKYADFTQLTRSHSLPEATNSTRIIYEVGARLLEDLKIKKPLRLIGVGVSNFTYRPENTAGRQVAGENPPPVETQAKLPGLDLPEPRLVGPKLHGPKTNGVGQKQEAGSLLPPNLDKDRERALDQALDKARKKFGSSAIMRGRLFEKE